MNELKIGDNAPDINSVDQDGNPVCLSDFRGKKVILFFYPKANTPGCAAEACSLRDNYSVLKDMGFELIGASADDVGKQKSFSSKHQFPFPLIPDTEKKVINDYGVWGIKKNYGKEYQGIYRKTFIISEEGKIEKIFNTVRTKDHAEQIIKQYEK
ncbi:MAG: thioredoxin-dependent thiol peroxidase [Bacteroidales bacterium]|jgi:peroxiredoxin Q/BCP|nr:thioredoxin-dependent thiol peroxidase [Bacteroidales bacterium]